MSAATILEIKEKFNGERKEFRCDLCSLTADEAVVIYRINRDVVFEGMPIPKNTLSFGYFWTDRLYNIYHWISPEGKTLGFYFNIGDRTQITPEQVYWRDLIVDLLITPEHGCRVLDEDELPADLAADLLALIETTRDELLQQHPSIMAEIEQRSQAFLADH